MQDQHFIRGWTDRHEQFSADIDSGLGHLTHTLWRHRDNPGGIDPAYESPVPAEARPGAALLHGFAAVVMTAALFTAGVTVLTAAYPAEAAQGPVALA